MGGVILTLTTREIECLTRVAAGMTNDEIAAELYLSTHTVKTHVWRLRTKLGARDRAHAVQRGWELGLLGDGRS